MNDPAQGKTVETPVTARRTRQAAAAARRIQSMGQDSIWKLLFRFSGPTIVSMMVASSYNIVDAIFVGRLGPEALAALTVSFPLMMIFMAIAFGTGAGAASLISRRLGAGDRDGASHAAGVAITLSLVIGATMAPICLPILDALLSLFGASGPVLALAREYMYVLVITASLAFFPLVVNATVRAEGNPVFASSIMIVSAVVNIIMDPLLIFGLGPFPEMGLAGAAIATVIGRGTGTLILVGYFLSGRSSYHFRPGHFVPDIRTLVAIYRIGIAAILQQLAGSIVMVVVNRTAATFGTLPLAVMGVVFRSLSFIVMPCAGIGQGMMPLVGFNFGAGQRARVGEVVMKAGLAATAWGLLWWVVILVRPEVIIAVFSPDPEFLQMGAGAVRIFGALLFAVGFQIATAFFFQGIGKALPSLVLASARQILFLLPALFILPPLFGLTGLWMSFPIADTLGLMATVVWAVYTFRRLGIPVRLRYPRPEAGLPEAKR